MKNFLLFVLLLGMKELGSQSQSIWNITQPLSDFLNYVQQGIAGVPETVLTDTINKLCSNAIAAGLQSQVTPNISRMNFQLRNNCQQQKFPLLDAEQMWRSPQFDASKKVVILATGWTTNINNSAAIDAFDKAYNCRGDVNFVALDASTFIDTYYTWSALNTEVIGMYVAKGLVHLDEIVPIANVHLIGHSLGAQIVGYAGRYFNYMTGKSIPRITGLDPAKPCFNEGTTLSGIQRGDADFIDIIHTSSGVVGERGPNGDVDFYPGGLNPIKPGCKAFDMDCSHERAWKYFEETIYPGNEQNFLGVRCNSLKNLREDKCPGASHAMGYAVPRDIKGNYFLDVNLDRPYGQNANENSTSVEGVCGRCQ